MVMIALAAFLVSAAFAPIGLWFLAVFGYALLFRKVANSRHQIWHFFLFGFIYNAIVLHWSGKYVGAAPWLLLSLLQALFYLPVGYVEKRFQNNWWTILTILAMEQLRANFPFGGFGWTRIAFSQVESPALQLVSYGGVLALSGITLVLASIFTKINLQRLTIGAGLLIGCVLLPNNAQGSGSVKLLAIQGNTPSIGLDFNSRAKAVFELHRDATYRFAREKYDAIIWPENAIDIDPRLYPEVASDIAVLNRKTGTALVAGVVLVQDGSPANASILYGPDGSQLSTYVKRGLTPFGEYMPLRQIAEFVSPFAKTVVDFKAGQTLQTHKIAGADIGPIICYEIIKDDLVSQMAKKSQAFIVQTNSATFSGTAESRQQLAITRIRAVENSREILSVSTIGISAFIDNNGRVVSQSKEHVQAGLTGTLRLNSQTSWANRLGNFKIGVLFALIAALAIRRSRRSVYL
jgi:apolipoprotein N-acyltransferase